jgi:hypothetical protein
MAAHNQALGAIRRSSALANRGTQITAICAYPEPTTDR